MTWILRPCAVAAVALAAWFPAPASAVISIDNSSTTSSDPSAVFPTFQYWNNVGNLVDNTTQGGGTYLQNGWVIAPRHIGSPGVFTFNHVGYPVIPGSATPVVDPNPANTTPTDLMLYRVDTQGKPALASLSINPVTPVVGSNLLMSGFSYARQAPLVYYDSSGNFSSTPPSGNYHEGYLWDTSTNPKRWGTNKVSITGQQVDDGTGTFQSFWTTFTDPNTTVSAANDPGGSATTYEASGAPGDSGGGVFVQNGSTWYLAGLIHAVDQFPPNNNSSMFYNPTLDGSIGPTNNGFAARTYMSDLSYYSAQIDSVIATPEPAAAGLLVAGASLGLLRRRRRGVISL